MKIINTAAEYMIYGDNLRVYDRLPAEYYTVECDKMRGFFLLRHNPFEINEHIYGAHDAKSDKVLRSFGAFNRNLGVILSGKKGIGKSLFAKLLCIKAHKAGLPVILVEKFVPDIAQYIASIEQETVVFFDEFDKTFGGVKSAEGMADPQSGLLTLFDGTSTGKKLFIITCNELNKINDYLVNRPGRFHYHFRFECPSDDEIREYMRDNLVNTDEEQIDQVVKFSRRMSLNYDCLRSIVFELNSGESFAAAIHDLNIVNLEFERYNLTLHYDDGLVLNCFNRAMDVFDADTELVSFYNKNGRNLIDILFDKSNVQFDTRTGQMYVPGDSLIGQWYDESEDGERLKTMTPKMMVIARVAERKYHYTV